jgi:diadenosine tetraphosphatase ApaH/serine/threonine PP2A family protein phosphatase
MLGNLFDITAPEFAVALKQNQHIQESAIEALFVKLSEILDQEPNVLYLPAPTTVCGDIHGQLLDLFSLFQTSGETISENQRYLFLGDYVDRGYSSFETFAYLAYLKVMNPNHMFLLRGNHESREVNQLYGLYNDCMNLYGHAGIWYIVNQVFDLLPIAAVVDDRIFCVHGGLSATITWIDQINLIPRKREIDPPRDFTAGRTLPPIDTQGLVDITWSDPEEVSKFVPNRRGKGSLFGAPQTRKFIRNNKLGDGKGARDTPGHGFVARSHQIAMKGWNWMHDNNLVIVWSAPNYCYKSGNEACVMKVAPGKAAYFQKFEKDPVSHVKVEPIDIDYFA